MSDSVSAPVHLAVDLGASGGRVIAGFLDDGKLQLDAVARFPNDAVKVQDTMQWNLLGLWNHIKAGLRDAALKYSNVQSVGVATWGVDYVLVDEQDCLVGPARHYRDSRTRGSLEKAFEIVPREEIFAATGLQFMEINSLYQLFSAAQAGESSLKSADGFLMIGDFFHWLLSGKRSIEATNASTTQLLDPRSQTWRNDLMERLGIPTHIFCECTAPGTQLGTVQESVANETGLHNTPIIVPATHDTASAVIAVPAANFAPQKPNWCYISSGTWSLMGCELAEPKINDLCSELNFTNEGGIHGSTRLLKNIGGLWVFQQIRKAILRRGHEISWEDMVRQAQESEPFQLLLDPDAADFVAPDDMIDAIQEFANRTNQTPQTDHGILFRSALEALALRYRVCLGMLESLVENQIDTIHVVGGGSMNGLLCQMTADACNRTVIAGPVEATAVGNVLVQMIGTNALESVEQARELVSKSFETTEYTPQNPEIWDEPAAKFLTL